MDVEIKGSGQWKGQAKLSKRGSGLLRQILYLAATRSISLEDSADREPIIIISYGMRNEVVAELNTVLGCRYHPERELLCVE